MAQNQATRSQRLMVPYHTPIIRVVMIRVDVTGRSRLAHRARVSCHRTNGLDVAISNTRDREADSSLFELNSSHDRPVERTPEDRAT